MWILDDDALDRIRARADGYDRDNAFPHEDLEELAAAGYLRMLVPTELGGLGLTLLEATAPAVEARRLRAGDRARHQHAPRLGRASRACCTSAVTTRLDWVLEDAAAGELFAFGNSEPGNDLVLWDSLDEGAKPSMAVTRSPAPRSSPRSPPPGRGSASSASDSGPTAQLVHGFLTRDTAGHRRSLDDWDTLGMRATQSNTTVLEGAFVPADRVSRILPVGPNADPFVFAIFANFLLLIGSVYAGIADRALELAVEAVKRAAPSPQDTGLSYDQDPDIRWRIADAALALDALAPQLESLAADVDGVVDHGADGSAAHGREAPRDRDRALRRRPGDAGRRAARHIATRASSAGCSATCSPASTTRATPSRCTRRWPRRCSGPSRTHRQQAHRPQTQDRQGRQHNDRHT